MGWECLLTYLGVNRKYISYQGLHLTAARSVALFTVTCELCICADRVMAAAMVWEETEGGRNGALMVRGEKQGAASFPGRTPRRIHLHLRSHLSPCRSSPHPTFSPSLFLAGAALRPDKYLRPFKSEMKERWGGVSLSYAHTRSLSFPLSPPSLFLFLPPPL